MAIEASHYGKPATKQSRRKSKMSSTEWRSSTRNKLLRGTILSKLTVATILLTASVTLASQTTEQPHQRVRRRLVWRPLAAAAAAIGLVLHGGGKNDTAVNNGNEIQTPDQIEPMTVPKPILGALRRGRETIENERSLNSIRSEKEKREETNTVGVCRWCKVENSYPVWDMLEKLNGCVVDRRGTNFPFGKGVAETLQFRNDPDAMQVHVKKPTNPIPCEQKVDCDTRPHILVLQEVVPLVAQKLRGTIEVKETRLKSETDSAEIKKLKKDIDQLKYLAEIYYERTWIEFHPFHPSPNNDPEMSLTCDRETEVCVQNDDRYEEYPPPPGSWEDDYEPRYEDEDAVFEGATLDFDQVHVGDPEALYREGQAENKPFPDVNNQDLFDINYRG